jgi:hypothetical protein
MAKTCHVLQARESHKAHLLDLPLLPAGEPGLPSTQAWALSMLMLSVLCEAVQHTTQLVHPSKTLPQLSSLRLRPNTKMANRSAMLDTQAMISDLETFGGLATATLLRPHRERHI